MQPKTPKINPSTNHLINLELQSNAQKNPKITQPKDPQKNYLKMLPLKTPTQKPPGEKQYSFEDILPVYKALLSEAGIETFADFMEAFRTFDREGQGYIAMAELRNVLTNLGWWCLFGGFFKIFLEFFWEFLGV